MKKVVTTLMCLLVLCIPAHASFLHELAESAREVQSEVDALYAEKNITEGNVSFRLAEGWMTDSSGVIEGTDTVYHVFANDGCSIMFYYDEYNLSNPDLADTIILSVTNAIKGSIDVVDEQTQEVDIANCKGYATSFIYGTDDDLKIEMITAFNSGQGIVNIVYNSESLDMPFIDDYVDMVNNITVLE